MNSTDRPKTSRGVANPNIDQFTSYVVPSPVHKDRLPHVLILDEGKPESTDEKMIAALGCWLFGSAMYV